MAEEPPYWSQDAADHLASVGAHTIEDAPRLSAARLLLRQLKPAAIVFDGHRRRGHAHNSVSWKAEFRIRVCAPHPALTEGPGAAMPKRKKWETLTDTAKIEELHREVLDLAGAIQTIRLDLAHIVRQLPKAMPKKK